MAKKVTLNTIASRLNISPSLASRALNGKYGVSEEMRELVKKTAEEMQYIPRITPTNKSVLLLLQFYLFDIFKDNDLYGCMVRGIIQRFEQEGIRVEPIFLHNYTVPEFTIMLKQKQACGVISISIIEAPYVDAVSSLGIPFSMIDYYYYNDNSIDQVRPNNFTVGYRAAKHLIELGHRNLAFVGNTDYSISFKDRFDGFAYYIKHCGVKNIRWQCVEDDHFNYHICHDDQIKKMLKASNRPTAIMCANDVIANVIYQHATTLGISIPQELSLVGCDNAVEWNFTTFDLYPLILGKIGAELLLKRMENPAEPIQYLQIEPQFQEGATTAPPMKP